MENQKLYLPHNLIIEILLRLSVKSLISFTCVCKSWLTLISNPDFANSHFQLTATAQTRRILFISHSSIPIQSRDFESSFKNDPDSLNLNFTPPEFCFRLQIKGSGRGFVFLHRSLNIYIWNPSTGFHKQIPLSPFNSNLEEYYFGSLYGFGYDQSRDDYLVVSISCDKTRSSHLEFFSLKDNSWREIEGTHTAYRNGFYNAKVGSLLNGAIHWLTYRRDSPLHLIVAFNLMERKLLEIPVPVPDDFHDDPPYFGLWVFGEFLSLWAMGSYNHTLKLRVMKEYKLHSSWTKTLVVRIDDAIPNFYPLCSTKSGDIIGSDGGLGLVKYNDKGQLLEYSSYHNYPLRSQAIMYTESLLSFPVDGEQV
ncbi:putative F-box domain, galactose oxidase/kelch, beta-propeller, F-box associated interaction [Medicago truncatula]|uniref:Galactose oxidase n=1 Tax=Medicago truncatula TaxID=3880 RepID=A0A072UNK5_MEDTR|nr:F-box/kelch-repeat protein At3g06240 [Medicago truncatula]KEH31282.1 galactose oxidase [Medicago truncatula]RHN62772.1 putative F-box domain, galactose oxidase/kelch, beta-propeller, F-box associated interaction [Medicago truncatula]